MRNALDNELWETVETLQKCLEQQHEISEAIAEAARAHASDNATPRAKSSLALSIQLNRGNLTILETRITQLQASLRDLLSALRTDSITQIGNGHPLLESAAECLKFISPARS